MDKGHSISECERTGQGWARGWVRASWGTHPPLVQAWSKIPPVSKEAPFQGCSPMCSHREKPETTQRETRGRADSGNPQSMLCFYNPEKSIFLPLENDSKFQNHKHKRCLGSKLLKRVYVHNSKLPRQCVRHDLNDTPNRG